MPESGHHFDCSPPGRPRPDSKASSGIALHRRASGLDELRQVEAELAVGLAESLSGGLLVPERVHRTLLAADAASVTASAATEAGAGPAGAASDGEITRRMAVPSGG
jgi:hypothetical protein